MFYGRPHEIVIIGDDGFGEPVPIGTEPTGHPPDPERRTFLLHDQPWRVFQAISREYGWEPAGTVPCQDWTGEQPKGSSYQPHSWRCKQVTAADAVAWAAALERALPILSATETRAMPITMVTALGVEGRGPVASATRSVRAARARVHCVPAARDLQVPLG